MMHNEKYWVDPHQFKPELFLENGIYLKNKHKAYIPFGVGRHAFFNDTIIINTLFLVLVRLLQNTSNYDLIIYINNNEPLIPDQNFIIEQIPKNYLISVNKRIFTLRKNR